MRNYYGIKLKIIMNMCWKNKITIGLIVSLMGIVGGIFTGGKFTIDFFKRAKQEEVEKYKKKEQEENTLKNYIAKELRNSESRNKVIIEMLIKPIKDDVRHNTNKTRVNSDGIEKILEMNGKLDEIIKHNKRFNQTENMDNIGYKESLKCTNLTER